MYGNCCGVLTGEIMNLFNENGTGETSEVPQAVELEMTINSSRSPVTADFIAPSNSNSTQTTYSARPDTQDGKSTSPVISPHYDISNQTRTTGQDFSVYIEQETSLSPQTAQNVTLLPFTERDSRPSFNDTFYFNSLFNKTSSLSTYIELESNGTAPSTLKEQAIDTAAVSIDFTQTSEQLPYWTLGNNDEDGEVTHGMIIKVFVLAVICVAGTVGNLMVIWTVVKERNLHRPPFYFLLSLGVTDLSRAVFCLPVMIATVLHGSSWRHGDSACELFAFATAFFVFSSALSLLAVAVERHISLLYPRAYKRRSHGGANILAAVLIWIIAFSISFPPVVGAGRYVFSPDEAQCAFQHSHYTNNDSLSSAIVLLVIMFLTFFLYFRIYRFLRAHRRMRPLAHVPAQSSSWTFVGQGANGQAFINWLNGFGGQAARQDGQRVVQRLNFGRVVNLSTTSSNKNEHLTRLFLILTLVFLFSWLPYITVSLIRVFSSTPPSSSLSTKGYKSSQISPLLAIISSWLGYAQVGLCPITFFLFRGPAGRRRKDLRTDYSMELAETERHKFLLENPIRK